MLVEVMLNFGQNEILPLFVCMFLLLKWAPERTMYYAVYFSASVINAMFLALIVSSGQTVLYLVTWGILAGGGAMWHINWIYTMLCSTVKTLFSWVLYSSDVYYDVYSALKATNTFPFWKEILRVSVSIIIQKFYKGTKKLLIHHVPKCWNNVFLNVFSVNVSGFFQF